MKPKKRTGWAVKWESRNRLDGRTVRFVCHGSGKPPQFSAYGEVFFATRADARAWVNEHYGYIKCRPDLKGEPHGWKFPKVVRAECAIREITR